MKATAAGTSHGLDGKYLQAYPDEMACRFNRRRLEDRIFDGLLSAVCQAPHLSLAALTG
jgi:hypothetical protein